MQLSRTESGTLPPKLRLGDAFKLCDDLMIVDYFCFGSISRDPPEYDCPLIIYSNAVIPSQISGSVSPVCLKAVFSNQPGPQSY
jgi:hypothetical protein